MVLTPAPPSRIQLLAPLALHQTHVEHALQALAELAGPPPEIAPAVAFLVWEGEGEPVFPEDLHWLAIVGGYPRRPWTRKWEKKVYLGAWLAGGLRTPIEAPDRLLPGRCPVTLFQNGTFARELLEIYATALTATIVPVGRCIGERPPLAAPWRQACVTAPPRPSLSSRPRWPA